MRLLLLILGLLAIHASLVAQRFGGIYTRFEDDLREWIITDPEGQEIGFLRMRWMLNNDITQWDYRIGEQQGEIRARWRDNFSEWEVHGGGQIITLRQIWRDVPTEWRLTNDEGLTIQWVTRWANTPEEWELREKREFGRFEQFTAWEGDPRDWVIIDELPDDFPLPMRMGMVFLPVLLVVLP
ncbi:MAG: hypothetical protein J5I41_01120 [Saprospiraceae bacterium]|nr:hypothetical protein [Saprospiraceae bacterium]